MRIPQSVGRTALVACLIVSGLFSTPTHADRLPATVVPNHYDLSFAVDLAGARFDGVETIRVDINQPTRQLVLHAIEIAFHDVTITSGSTTHKAAVSLNEGLQTATLTVPQTLARGPADIRLNYTGILNDKLRGFYLSTENDRRYAVTQLEATDARRAFPSFDEPAFKATFDVTLTIDRGDTAISNGKVIADTPTPDGARHIVKFSTTPKMSTYLVALAVGRFACVEGAAESVPIRICATEGKQELGRVALDMAQQILTFYNRYFAIKYPYGKLDVLAVPDFAAGAMENTAAIFYRETDLLVDAQAASLTARKRIGSVLAHEMAHQWFGDLVTMKWWDDIWLNEGFATWMANRPLAAMRPDWNIPVDEALENQTALNLDGLKSTRPVHAAVETPAEIDEAFDAIAYEKGASVLRMIENYLGPDTFRRGINAYLQAHAYGNATSQDFWRAMTVASGKPVDKILPSFVNQPGAPLLDVTLNCANNRSQVTIAQQRFFLDSALLRASPTARWQVPVCLKAAGASGISCDVVAQERQTLFAGGNSCVPWVFANAGAQGYYRTAYGPDAVRAIAPRIEEGLTAPERLTMSGDEWALVRAGRHTAADYLTLSTGFANEHTNGVLSNVTGRLDFIKEYLTGSADRPRFEQFVRSLFSSLFHEIGFSSTPVDTDERRALRGTLIATLGTTGADEDLAAKARAALDRALAGGPPLEPTAATAIVGIAARRGDAALFDALVAAAERATSPGERYRYLYAIPLFRDPALIDRGLEYALTAKLRSQDAASFIATFLGEEAARPRAWAFLKRRWKELEPKITIVGGDTAIVGSLAAFCDASSRDEIASFFADHPLPSAARTLGQTLERINNCIDLRTTQTPIVAKWIANH
jgi:aminopeptidase N